MAENGMGGDTALDKTRSEWQSHVSELGVMVFKDRRLEVVKRI
jgi:hypothetical protein